MQADPEEVLLLLSDLHDEVLATFPALRGRLVSNLPVSSDGRGRDADG
jgi:hypothetical protein